ncbi:hypothetical protein RhiirC2_845019 [Rhizophagus irregularis]|uniref:Uncharacterized protein n=1 Tax=Rhizophagus irregularis TaxID=588596 RepID=A0A2N1NRV8_9GLOM|nr:hypothetical protein RhiirC2_845019 [Rhizophagus irregularis]
MKAFHQNGILAQRTQSVSDESDESDQQSVANNSVASSQSESSSYSGSSSSNSSFFENAVAREIRQLKGKKIGGATIKSFYHGYSDSKYSTVKLISKWLDSKENISSLDNNQE